MSIWEWYKWSRKPIGLNDVTVTSSLAIRRKTPVALSVIEPLVIEEKLGTQEFPEILKSTPGCICKPNRWWFLAISVSICVVFESANIAVHDQWRFP
jgi:hypothetical protein